MVSSKKASEYEIMDEFVVTQINKPFNQGNIFSEALETMVKLDTDLCNQTLKINPTFMQWLNKEKTRIL